MQRPFLEMRLIDATINGGPEVVAERASELLSLEGPTEDVEPSEGAVGGEWARLYTGASVVAAPGAVRWLYAGRALRIGSATGPSLQAEAVVVEGRASSEELDALLERRWPSGVVEGAASRLAWERELAAAASSSGGDAARTLGSLAGRWRFAFRSYTNDEELGAMLSCRLGLQWLLLRVSGKTQLEVAPDGAARLVDSFLLFGGLPLGIAWSGALDAGGGSLVWDRSEAWLGWEGSPLCLRFDRPAAAERLRKDPWGLEAVLEGGGWCLAVLRREGCGRLAFLKEE